MSDIKYIRSKVYNGDYLSMKEKKEYIMWCITKVKMDNEGIIQEFKNYNINPAQFEFDINNLRAKLTI